MESRFAPDPLDAPRDAVRLEGSFPLDWSEAMDGEAALAETMADNATLLRALLMFDEPAPVAEGPQSGALQNLERRVDLLLLLASSALRGLGRLPAEQPCVLTGRHLSWGSDAAIGVGRRVWARLYLRHRIPLPLVLPGQIVEESDEGELLWHRLELEPLEPSLQNDLERFVFRHHRRQVARQRAGR